MKKILLIFFMFMFTSCVGTSTVGVFGSGVSVALDPRTIGTQIDDSIMQKNLGARLTLVDKNYFLNIKVKVIDGKIFLTGKVNEPEEKLLITKMAWETKGVRSVRNDIAFKKDFTFKSNAKDILITAQLRAAFILNKNIKSANYNIDTLNKKIYVYGIAQDENEKKDLIQEAKQIVDVEEVITSILLVSDLTRQKN